MNKPRIPLAALRTIVTGASSGIGLALVRELHAQGGSIVAVARRGDRIQALADELHRPSRRLIAVTGDITDPQVRQAAIDAAVQGMGGFDVLVNNAGTSVQGDFASGNDTQFRRVFEVNFFAAVELTRLALPHLRKSPLATIVNVGSILGHRATPFNSEYCASKFALRGWSESLRAELAEQGIHVLLVSPGTTDTEFFANVLEKRREMPWKQRHGVTPQFVAQAIARAIARRENEITPHRLGKLMVLANRLAPRMLDRVMRRLTRDTPPVGDAK